MKLTHPIENFKWANNISQLFGVNKALYKPSFGIEGHNGIDIVVQNPKQGYGEKILAAHDGVVTKIIDDSPIRTKGIGLYLLSDVYGGVRYETIYWHLSGTSVEIGQRVKAGDTIGLMGNSGFVRPQPSTTRPYDGTHLHFAVRKYNATGQQLNPYNDYHGLVDPTPLLYKQFDKLPILWRRNLNIGKSGDDVSWLQTVLKIEGFAQDYEPIGYFGYKTFRDVRNLQLKRGIVPASGFFGNFTLNAVKQYSVFH